MIAKTFELRDRGTFVPVLAVKLEPTNKADEYLFARAGYGGWAENQSKYVLLMGLGGGCDKMTCDPYDWGDNGTRFTCHSYIITHFDELQSGQVLDAEFIRGETAEPKKSERDEDMDAKLAAHFAERGKP